MFNDFAIGSAATNWSADWEFEQNGQSGPIGKRLGQYLGLLLRQLQLLKNNAGNVAARPRQAADIAARYRIEVDRDHDDRKAALGGNQRLQNNLRTGGHNHVRV